MTRITLVLATGRGFPAGSADHRYEVELALDPAGRMDEQAWRAAASPWAVRRFRPDAPPREGELRWDEETGWSFRFAPLSGDGTQGAELTEPILNAGVLRPGEHVTVQDESGEAYGYRIVSMA